MKRKMPSVHKKAAAIQHKFIAIGVGQGDAFYLERNGLSLLVDGGKSVESFPNQFQRATQRDFVNYLVCTHNDSDHANGILGFLHAGLWCDEVWLPGSWTDRLADILDADETLFEALAGECQLVSENSDESAISLTALGDAYSFERENSDENQNGDTTNELDKEFQSELNAKLENATRTSFNLATILSEIHRNPRWLYWRLEQYDFTQEQYNLFLNAIKAIERIRSIAIAAYHNGVPIRWFEYRNSGQPRGGNHILRPVNAVEFALVRKPKISMLRYLALSVANRESLVFQSPRSNDFPGALFLADSDLTFSQNIPHCGLITVPHHGSEANANAYVRLASANAAAPDTVWARSDGNFKSRPGNSYTSLMGRKFCTLCRGAPRPKQDLFFSAKHSSWKTGSRVVKCSC